MGYFNELSISGTTENVNTDYVKNSNIGALQYDDPDQVSEHVAICLSRIFMTTHKEKIKREIEKLKVMPKSRK
jgi:hypothetical protein